MAEILVSRQLGADMGVEDDIGGTGRFAAVSGVQKRFHLGAGLDGFFDRAGSQLVLVGEVGEGGAGENSERGVGRLWGGVRDADGEECGYQDGVVEREAVDYCAAPGRKDG